MNKLPENIKLELQNLLKNNPLIAKILQKINQSNGKAFLVGGAVRDLFLNLSLKDLDIEVHGLTAQQLEEILKSFGPVSLVGKIYGVLRLHGLDIDWSLPRSDTAGRKPIVKVDPNLAINEAFKRRDLTINAMGIDLNNFELVDPFNGFQDLKNKILRFTDAKLFVEDPLRFFRVMQFIGRFEMFPDDELNKICKTMDIQNISRERIEQEFTKLFLKSKKPSIAIRWLKDIGRLQEILPELYTTIGIKQNPQWHPEGDVFEHTMQALDAAANLDYNSENEKLIIMWAALCHDLGKVTTTENLDDKITSYGHEEESEILAKKMLKRITNNADLITTACTLVRYHMQPAQLVKDAKPPAYKRLAKKLAPYANFEMLTKLMLVDHLGRNPKKGKPLTGKVEMVEKFLQKVNDLDLLQNIEEPILHGKDLLDVVPPGPKLGKLIKKAYEIQIEEGIKDKEELKKRILKKD